MRTCILLLVLTLSGCAVFDKPDDWTKEDTIAELSWQAMNVVDYKQTSNIQYQSNIVEVDPLSRSLVGPNPSSSDAAQLIATYAISHYLISKYLPKRYRKYWLTGTIVTKKYIIESNRDLGL